MNPQDLMNGMAEKNRMLTQKNDEYLELVEKRAQAERAYNISVARVTLERKAEGQSITLIDKLVRGDKTVAELKYQLDVAEGTEKACVQSIKALMIAVDTYRSLLTWLRAEMERA